MPLKRGDNEWLKGGNQEGRLMIFFQSNILQRWLSWWKINMIFIIPG